jgi:hypothetical protein
VLHVGKTGGTALKHALLEHGADTRYQLLLHGHDVTVAHVPRGEDFAFVLRDPISRFVSAFNARRHEGHPRYRYPWSPEERRAFASFDTPVALATALSSSDVAERARAERAMRGIGHLNTPYRYWFGGVRSFRRRLSDVFFVAFQERLDDDFELLKQKLGLPGEARLPSDPVTAHKSTASTAAPLSQAARANLERWYEADYTFLRFCGEVAQLVNAGDVPRQRRTSPLVVTPPSTRGRLAPRIVLAPLAGGAAFAATGAVAEATTDRDWTLSGLEWPADFATAAGLVCLVPIVWSAGRALLQPARGISRAAEDS